MADGLLDVQALWQIWVLGPWQSHPDAGKSPAGCPALPAGVQGLG